MPEGEARQHHGRCAGPFVFRHESATDEWLDAEHVDEIRRHGLSADVDRSFGGVEHAATWIVSANHGECFRAGPQRLQNHAWNAHARPVTSASPDLDETIGLLEGKGAQQHGVHEGEQRGRRADANRERGDGEQ